MKSLWNQSWEEYGEKLQKHLNKAKKSLTINKLGSKNILHKTNILNKNLKTKTVYLNFER